MKFLWRYLVGPRGGGKNRKLGSYCTQNNAAADAAWTYHQLTYLLTHSMQHSPSWEPNRLSSSQEIPRILWNPEVHYRIQIARHLSLSWASSIKSITPHPTSWRSILILSSHLCLCLPSALSLRFPHQNLEYDSPLPYMRYTPHPSHSARFYQPKNIV